MGILELLTEFVMSVIESGGYFGIFILMALEGSFIPLPSEIILPFSGFLASKGQFSILAIALVGALGNIVGTLFTYTIARYVGLPFLYRYGKYVLVTHHDIELAQSLFEKFGVPIIFISRLLPGIRGFIPIPAGVARMKVIPFMVYVFVGSFLWSLLLTYIGVIIQENWEVFGEYAHDIGTVLVLIMLIGIGWWLKRQFKQLSKERRDNTYE
jgi:membrane protein DedA with SNARE-associated domain